MKLSHAETYQLEAEAGLKNLWYFLGGEHYPNGQRTGLALDMDSKVHGDFVHALGEDDWDEVIAMLARGMFKSSIGCGYIAWRTAKNRNFRATLISSTFDVSEDNISLMEQMLESEWVEGHYGVFKSADDWSTKSFTVRGRTKFIREPTVRYKSLQSFRPGGHNDLIWVDDIEDQDTVRSDAARAQVRKVMGLLYPMADEAGARILTTGTFWGDDDAYCRKEKTLDLKVEVLENGRMKWKRKNGIRKSFEFEGADGSRRTMRIRYFYKPAINPDGTALFPQKLSLAELERRRTATEMTASMFNAQYLLDPVGGEDSDFPAIWFEDIYTPDPSLPKNDADQGKPYAVFYGVDASIGRRADGDYTAFVGVKVFTDLTWYVFEAARMRVNGLALIAEVIARHKRYPRALWVIEEDNYIAGLRTTFRDRFLEQNAFPTIEWPKAGSRGKKEARIRAYRGRFQEKTVTMARGTEVLEDELTRFPEGERRDVADALANVHEFATITAVRKQIELPKKSGNARIAAFRDGRKNLWQHKVRRGVPV